jgi:nitroimidazol reductase NimA-like FMN-containing flavoprotein (pyridoxamine 5'-phosphate oxidase superfamily)
MGTTDPTSKLAWMDRAECLRLLAADVVGRLAVVDGRTPVIFPVNYVLDHEEIVFRTDPGTKLHAGPRAHACLEIDEFDRVSRTGWSVIAAGRLEEVTQYDSATWRRVHELDVDPWAAGAKEHWMRLVPTKITGRRIG